MAETSLTMNVSTRDTSRSTLQFLYEYQYINNSVPLEIAHIELARLCQQHLMSSSSQEGCSDFPWNCSSDAVDSDKDFVRVSVQFVHNRYGNDSALSAPDAIQLWRALKQLFDCETSHTVFGGHGFAIYMRPVNLQEKDSPQFVHAYAFQAESAEAILPLVTLTETPISLRDSMLQPI